MLEGEGNPDQQAPTKAPSTKETRVTVAPAPITASRRTSLDALATRLQAEQHRKLDVIAPSTAIRAHNGRLIVDGTTHELSETGVTSAPGVFAPTGVCETGIADKLGIPVSYLRKTRVEAPDLWDANVNGWLKRAERSYMVRAFRPTSGGAGVARAFLSPGYRIIDNLDILTAALEGVRQTGASVQIESCDLSDKRMYIRITSEEVRAYAPALLRRYRSPFTGARGADNPVVFAGFEISNSETGCGAFTIVPRMVVQVCKNGMTITEDAIRAVHLGGRQEDGVVRWSDRTQALTLELVTAKTVDAVRTVLNKDYMMRHLRSIEAAAGAPVTDPEATITTVSQRLKFTEATRAAVFSHFIAGADVTAGGVLHAVTSVAQTLADPDEAHDLEALGLKAMQIAATA